MKTKSVLVALAAVIMTTVPVNAKLKEGDPAPPITVTKWVKGAPVTKFVKGRVYVVEFWATWCGPCREAIPHLTKLARAFKGTVTFAGINVWEQEKGAKRVAMVTDFVRDMGGRMVYNVAMDTDSGATSNTWLPRDGKNGIPTAFVVGKNGRIAWIGQPMQMDNVLPSIVKGTFNARAEAQKRLEYDALSTRLAKVDTADDCRRAVQEIDKFVVSHPDMESLVGFYRFIYLLQYDVPAAIAYADRLAAGIYEDDAMFLSAMVSAALDPGLGLSVKDYPVVLSMAERANALTAGKDANCLDTLAAVYANTGDMAKALAMQERAVTKLDKTMPNDEKKTFMDHLAEYKAKAPK